MARSSNRRYHDRVASRYEERHEGDPYLSFCRELTWRHLKRSLPASAGAAVLDAGCGPGHFGVKLLRSGYAVDFLDLSEGMLEQARARCEEAGVAGGVRAPRFLRASLDEPDGLPGIEPGRYALVLALGDVLSFVADARRALKNVRTALCDGGFLVASVDHRFAGIEHFLEGGNLDALAEFLATGRSEWLAKRKDERFATRMFTAPEIERALEASGFRLVSLIGRPVLPLARNRARLSDPETRRKLLAIEKALEGEREALGRASHLEFTARAIGASPSGPVGLSA